MARNCRSPPVVSFGVRSLAPVVGAGLSISIVYFLKIFWRLFPRNNDRRCAYSPRTDQAVTTRRNHMPNNSNQRNPNRGSGSDDDMRRGAGGQKFRRQLRKRTRNGPPRLAAKAGKCPAATSRTTRKEQPRPVAKADSRRVAGNRNEQQRADQPGQTRHTPPPAWRTMTTVQAIGRGGNFADRSRARGRGRPQGRQIIADNSAAGVSAVSAVPPSSADVPAEAGRVAAEPAREASIRALC